MKNAAEIAAEHFEDDGSDLSAQHNLNTDPIVQQHNAALSRATPYRPPGV